MKIPQEVFDFLAKPVDYETYAGHIYHPDGKRHESRREGAVVINKMTSNAWARSTGWYAVADTDGRFLDLYEIYSYGKLSDYLKNPVMWLGKSCSPERTVIRDTDDGRVASVGYRLYRNRTVRVLAADYSGELFVIRPGINHVWGRFSKNMGSSDPMEYYKGRKMRFPVLNSHRGDARNLELTSMSETKCRSSEMAGETIEEIVKVFPKWEKYMGLTCELKFTSHIYRLLTASTRHTPRGMTDKLKDIRDSFRDYRNSPSNMDNIAVQGKYLAFIHGRWGGTNANVLDTETGKKYSLMLESGSQCPFFINASSYFTCDRSVQEIIEILSGITEFRSLKSHRESLEKFLNREQLETSESLYRANSNIPGVIERLVFGKTSRLVNQLLSMDMPYTARLVALEKYFEPGATWIPYLFFRQVWAGNTENLPVISMINKGMRSPSQAFGISNRNLRYIENSLSDFFNSKYKALVLSNEYGQKFTKLLKPFGLARFQATFPGIPLTGVDDRTFEGICSLDDTCTLILEDMYNFVREENMYSDSDLIDNTSRGKTAADVLDFILSLSKLDRSVWYKYKDSLRMASNISRRLDPEIYGFQYVPDARERMAALKVNLFPRLCDIPYIHDELVRIQMTLDAFHNEEARKRLEKENKLLDDEYEKLKPKISKYEFSNGDYIIRKPECMYDIVREGNLLHHCVGSYRKSVSEGREIILFLRHASDPETPWFTIDMTYSGHIRQIHNINNGDICNHPENKGIMSFLNLWSSEKGVDRKSLTGSYGLKCAIA